MYSCTLLSTPGLEFSHIFRAAASCHVVWQPLPGKQTHLSAFSHSFFFFAHLCPEIPIHFLFMLSLGASPSPDKAVYEGIFLNKAVPFTTGILMLVKKILFSFCYIYINVFDHHKNTDSKAYLIYLFHKYKY